MFDVKEHAKEILAAVDIRESEPTDEQLKTMVVAIIHPVLLGIAALDRIATALERIANKQGSRV